MPTDLRADEQALREARRDRALAQMETHDIDALLLGREANARYVAGAQRLWTAGTRPFGPSCVVVRRTGAIHLVSTWDVGIPDEIPHSNLFGITWNPGNLLRWLENIEGLSDARRIGTDSLTPRFARLLPKLFPSAAIVDAEPAMEAARRVKSPEEVEAIRAALSVAESAMSAAVNALRPGVSERHLAGVFMHAMAAQGVTTPATQRVAWVSRGSRPAGESSDGLICPEDLVAFDAGVVAGGYVGEVGRTWPATAGTVDASARDLYRRVDDLFDDLLHACQPGASCSGLLAAYRAQGQALPPFPIATGLGLGFDVPVVTRHLPMTAEEERIDPGMVLAVSAWVTDKGSRTVLRKEAVLIGADGPTVITSSPYWLP